MPRYTIRIELHKASWQDYEAMYALLAKQGITDTIKSDDGNRYTLPPAEYNYDGPATRAQVLDMAKASASNVARTFAIVVTESAGRTWFGLDKV